MTPATYAMHVGGLIFCVILTTWLVEQLDYDTTVAPAVTAGIYLLNVIGKRV